MKTKKRTCLRCEKEINERTAYAILGENDCGLMCYDCLKSEYDKFREQKGLSNDNE